jgi:hypothetical protein
MLKRLTAHFDDMVLATAVWMCSLPLVGLLVIPLLGLKASLVVAAMLFIVIVIVCWGICSWKIFRD